MTFPTWQHKFTSAKPYTGSGYGKGASIKVEAGLHYLEGNRLPYFSVTGEIGHRGREPHAGGMLHEEILAHWPNLAPVIALHLSDSEGVPMHAAANSWYQLAGYFGGAGERYHAGNSERQIYTNGEYVGYREPTPDECLESFAAYVRLPLAEAKALADNWWSEDGTAIKRWHHAWIETQRPRWQAEANAATVLLDHLAHRVEV